MLSTKIPVIRPEPRRPSNPNDAQLGSRSPLLPPSSLSHHDTPSRTHSVLNLTSSTLLGIYSPTGYQSDRDEPLTPWGTGADTPANSTVWESPQRAVTASSTLSSLTIRLLLLFCLGMSYGLLVQQLHDDRQLAPFQADGIMWPSVDLSYLILWGVAGIVLGSLLPWVDIVWEQNLQYPASFGQRRRRNASPSYDGDSDALASGGILGADWTPVVRSIGAFAGIAFAIRKLPWASPLQASLTLALVNPVLWYIIDRSEPGFIFSASVGVAGTALLLVSNPDIVPSPGTPRNSTLCQPVSFDHGFGRLEQYIRRESLEGGVWILSVLFCSCVCFGNIGRRLALLGVRGQNRIISNRTCFKDAKSDRQA